ncbi:serine hydrolase [Auraticoccus sp. F435]|uniref:Serine hydrolase n=1 Tax=Auraticoccus cholistanensis TaxID=2656650 RepID=A0A6A9UTH7_9ACTN|nr:serine hydrolase domain-containing protein [Auraticoccus cholistanensis]MVA76236.1 serine hydrolase [Auraticoccus cholistanensis]
MTPLPRSTPSAQQVDAGGVLALLDALDAAGTEMHSLMVLRHGHVVAEGWWAPYTAERRHLLYSLSKSFTSTAAGFAVAEGLLDLDDTVLSHFPELDAEVTDPRSRAMRVRHVAAMASGHTGETLQRAVAVDPVDVVRGFLLTPPEAEPGTVFAYNQPCTFTLGRIVQRRSGHRLTEYLRPRLLDPLGIGEVGWLRHGEDDMGFTGLHARTEDIARLGQLYLQRGRWDGVQLLDEEWVADATRAHVSNEREPNPDWQQGYGFQFWMSRHGYRGDGAYGQFCLVLPEQDAVVATTAATEDMQTVLDAVWAHLLPALGAHPDADAETELAQRLQQLRLDPVAVGSGPAAPDATPRELTVVDADDRTPPGLTAVTVQAGEELVRLTLHQRTSRLEVGAAPGDWLVGEAAGRQGPVPVAASAGWPQAGTLQVEVAFLETPHRLVVTCSEADGTATARWRTVPLHQGELDTLRCPD